MKTKLLFIFLIGSLSAYSQAALRPFPQHPKYSENVIVPDHVSQEEMDDSVQSFYTQWKQRYIKKSSCSESYYVWAENAGENHQCVSEGQGYGMMILVLMSGNDTSEQHIFDGLYRYYIEHPSLRNKYLMSWAQSSDCNKFEESSATDGDIDIAYSLILADAQWTSKGKVNYIGEAAKIINAIWEQEVNQKLFTILQSNSIEYDSPDYFDTRSSDFIPSEIRAFPIADSNHAWNKVLDAGYKLFNHLQKTYSDEAGLVPDFIQNINTRPKPAKRSYLESKYDGVYNYNACRVPWRIATDYIIYGDKRAGKFVEPINKWIRETTGNQPDNISAGYTLAGDDLRNRNFEALCFISSFAISSMVDSKNQLWLNKLYDYIIAFKLKDFDYYDNSIKMLNLVILSHNYWAPTNQ